MEKHIEKLLKLCAEVPADLDAIDTALGLVDDINMECSWAEPGENLLSVAILGYKLQRGQALPELVRLFLKHGFDVTRGNGSAGAQCLINLTWSSYDDYILEAAKLLLDAGADPTAEPFSEDEDSESILSWVATKANGEIIAGDDFESSNRFCVLYDILDAAIHGWDYSGIYNFGVCVGKTIEGVSLCHGAGENAALREEDGALLLTTPLEIRCGGLPLCLYHRVEELYVGHYTLRKLPERTPITDGPLATLLGKTIREIRMIADPDSLRGSHRGIVRMLLEDGSDLLVRYGESWENLARLYLE